MSAFGFSSHAPLPFYTGWNMPGDKLDEYLAAIEKLRAINPNGPRILKSLEVDYIPGVMGPAHPLIKDAKLDYIVGSVHFVDAYEDGIPWTIDFTNDEFDKGLKQIFKGDIQAAVTRYFHLQNEMLERETPQILGHLDKIKMHNGVGRHFNSNDRWYRSLVHETMLLAAEKQVVVEINTKYINRGGILFPSSDYFKWMKTNKVPVTISSDAHKPEALTRGFNEVARMLSEAGHDCLWQWEQGVFVPMPLTTP